MTITSPIIGIFADRVERRMVLPEDVLRAPAEGRARLKQRPAPPDAAPPSHADLEDVFSDLLDQEITPSDPQGRSRTVLGQLARSYFKVRDGDPDVGERR